MNGDTPQDNSNQDEQSGEEPKIVVDSDWKEQVAREREQPAEPEAEEDAEITGDTEPSGDESAGPPAPPASFEVLITMLFTQAMTLLGQVPDPSAGEIPVNKAYAKHYIDTLEMLGEKTEGNLTETESSMLSEALHALRMTYVNVKG